MPSSMWGRAKATRTNPSCGFFVLGSLIPGVLLRRIPTSMILHFPQTSQEVYNISFYSMSRLFFQKASFIKQQHLLFPGENHRVTLSPTNTLEWPLRVTSVKPGAALKRIK